MSVQLARIAPLVAVIVLAGGLMPIASGAALEECDPVVAAQVPQVAARDGTPLVVSLTLRDCAFEEFGEARAWLGNQTHQSSRVHDGNAWATSQQYVDLDGFAADGDLRLVVLQANPSSANADALVRDVPTVTAWLRLRGDAGPTAPLALGSMDWVDADRVAPYWGQPGAAWLQVRSSDGSLLGSAPSGVDGEGFPSPPGFARVAVPAGAPASGPAPLDPGDLVIARVAPALSPQGSLVEVLARSDMDLGGLRVQSRSGDLVLPPRFVEAGTLVRFVSDPAVPVASLDDQVPDDDWGDPVVVSWGESAVQELAKEGEKGEEELEEELEEFLVAQTAPRFQLARSGGFVRLVYGDTGLDSFVYGDGVSSWHWHNEWSSNGVEATRVEARVFLREHTEAGFVDMDQAADWIRARVHRQHQADLGTEWFRVEGPVRAWVCPDRCHEEVMMRIQEASSSIDVNLYELTLPSAVHALAQAAQGGVTVRVLVHDRPVAASQSRMDNVAWAVDHLVAAGAQVRTMAGLRYDVNHAKYLVVDGSWSVVLTENAVQRGWPTDGASGNRGHGVAVRDPALARWMTDLFEHDFLHPVDARPVTGKDLHADAQPVSWPPSMLDPPPAAGQRVPTLVVEGGFPVAPVLAPDHLGDTRRNPVAEVLEGARESVGMAQLNLPLAWSRPGHVEDSPLTLALLTAAQSGAGVTGTLAVAFIDPDGDGNHRTAAALAQSHDGIDLRLGGAPHPDGVVHAKTWWVDPGTNGAMAITGSANGNLASQANNREVGFMLAHPEIASYWAQVAKEDMARAESYGDFAPDEVPRDETQGAREVPAGGWMLLFALLLLTRFFGRTRGLTLSHTAKS